MITTPFFTFGTNGGRHIGGTENLIGYSETFENWSPNTGSVVTNVGPAADGTGLQTADRLVPSTATSSHYFTTAVPLVGIGTVSVYAKPDGYASISFSNGPNNWVHYDLSGAGSISTLGTGWTAASIQLNPSNGYYLCAATSSSITWAAVYLFANPAFVADGNTYPGSSGAGDGVKGVLCWGAMLNTGGQRLGYKATP